PYRPNSAHEPGLNQQLRIRMSKWKGKRIFITGVCGTVGTELLKQVIARDPAEIIGIDNNESELFFREQEFGHHDNVNLYLGDIGDKERVVRAMRGVDIVLHTAALKHVVLCEKTPHD